MRAKLAAIESQRKHLKKVVQVAIDYAKTFSCSTMLSVLIIPILKGDCPEAYCPSTPSVVAFVICFFVLIWILVDADLAR